MTHRMAALGYTTLSAIAAGAAAVTSSRYARDIAIARTRLTLGSRIADTRCGPIEFADAGHGFPVLVIHGAGGGFDQGLDFGEPFLKQGLRVIAPSRFGYLRTPLPGDASAVAQADAHAALLEMLDVEKVIVMGASAGSPSATQFCLRHPERCVALILTVPALFSPAAAQTNVEGRGITLGLRLALRSDFGFWAAMQIAEKALVRAILGTPESVFESASEEEKLQLRTTLQHILPISARQHGLLNDFAVTTSLEPYPLEEIKVPALLMTAADDLYRTHPNASYSAEHIPDATLTVFASGGHLLVGHEQEVEALVRTFVSEVLLLDAA